LSKKKFVLIVILILLGLSFNSEVIVANNLSKSSKGIILYVGGSGPGNHSTIQEAIFNATNGDTIFVFSESSPYYEHISIYKEITVIGENKDTTIIDGNGTGIIVTITEPDVIIKEFTIQNGYTGIEVDGSCDNVSIQHMIITDCTEMGIDVNGFNEFLIIEYNIIKNCKNASSYTGTSYSKINHNSFENSEYGIVFNLWCNQNQIHFNNFLNNEKDAFFFTSVLNSWLFNYWDRPRILPKPLVGLVFFFPFLNFDWRPLIRPVEI
jgi:nitrous oxidase accessory protein NosD